MAARAPLDVDLEDKLVYGLTPMRLAYMAVAFATGFGFWSSPWAPGVIRGATAAAVILVGAAAAWGRWRGRAADEWASDLGVFLIRNYEVEWRGLRRRTPEAADPIEVESRDPVDRHVELAA